MPAQPKKMVKKEFAARFNAWRASINQTDEKRDLLCQAIRQSFQEGTLESFLNPVLVTLPQERSCDVRSMVREQTDEKSSIRQVPGDGKGYEVTDTKTQTAPRGSKPSTIIKQIEKIRETIGNLKLGEIDHSAEIKAALENLELTQKIFEQIVLIESGVESTETIDEIGEVLAQAAAA